MTVGFQQGEYTVREASEGTEVCVDHKGKLQREVIVEVYQEGMYAVGYVLLLT